MSLFDKLVTIQKEHEQKASKNTVPEQASSATVEKSNADETPMHVIDKLQEIGDQHAINPPSPEEQTPPSPEEQTPPPPEEQTPPSPEDTATEPDTGPPATIDDNTRTRLVPPANEKKPPNGKKKSQKCPTCNHEFKVLAKHRCKAVSDAPPEPPTEPQDSPEPSEVSKDTPPESWPLSSGPGPHDVEASGSLKGTGAAITSENGFGVFSHDPSKAPPEHPNCKCDVVEVEAEKPLISAGYDLYIDCMIWGAGEGSPQFFVDMIGPLAGEVASENQVPYWSVVEYGKGPGFLADKLECWLRKVEPQGHVMAMSGSPEYRACRDVLIRNARTVVIGIA